MRNFLLFLRVCAHVRVLMTRKSRAVEMRDAILRNHLESNEHTKVHRIDWVRLNFNFRCSCFCPHNKITTGFSKFYACRLCTQHPLVRHFDLASFIYSTVLCLTVNCFVLTMFRRRQNEVYLLSLKSFFSQL